MGKSIVRTLSFYSKWLAEVLRQPSLMLTLVIGPFLILLAFGEGVKLGVPRPRTLLVVPAGGITDPRLDPRRTELDRHLRIVGETTSLSDARRRLAAGDVDLVALLPADPLAAVRSGRRAEVRILTNEIDPVRGQYAWAYLQDQVATLNQQTIEHAIGESTGGAEEVRRTVARAKTITAALREARGDAARTRALLGDLRAALRPLDDSSRQAAVGAAGAELLLPGLGEPTGGRADLASAVARLRRSLDAVDGRAAPGDAPLNDGELAQIEADLAAIDRAAAVVTSIPAWVLSAPFHLELENVAPFVPDYLSFYAPAVVALLMQHLAITLGALSMTRVRLLGLTELLQTAPVRPSEAVAGNYLSYGTLCALAAAALVAALVLGLGVPVTGPWALVAGTVALLILTSLGGGFVVSMVAGSEQQAAQVAMLALIASVFLSGFVVSLDTIVWPVRALSYLLPSTYAIRGLQDVMLRGAMRHPADLVVLAMAALAACALTLVLVRREYRPR